MKWNDLEKHFSPARLGRYRAARGGDATKAAADYSSNVLLSEAMVPMLNASIRLSNTRLLREKIVIFNYPTF